MERVERAFKLIVESGPSDYAYHAREDDYEPYETRTFFSTGTGRSGLGGCEFLLTSGSNVIGKSPDCPVYLKHPTVSRRHAEIKREGERLTIVDLFSLNGTSLNGETLSPGVVVPLNERDLVTVGKFELRCVGS